MLLLPISAQAATLLGIIGKITAAVVPIGTPLVVVGFIIAGFLYISAAASPERMALAKKALIAAVIGTILIILASTACAFIAALFGLPASSCSGGSAAPKITDEAVIPKAATYQAKYNYPPATDEKTAIGQAQQYDAELLEDPNAFNFRDKYINNSAGDVVKNPNFGQHMGSTADANQSAMNQLFFPKK